MPQVVWSPRSRRDLARVDEFLRTKSRRAADGAFAAILQGVETLELFPLAGRAREEYGPGRREWSIRFGSGGYVLLYEVRDQDVVVIAVRHSREADYPDLIGS